MATTDQLTTEPDSVSGTGAGGVSDPLSPTSPSPPGPSTIVIVLGDVVLLSQQRVAIVKYVGHLPNQNGIYYGVEIRMTEGPLGNCDGTYNDVRYFDCAPNCGLFAKYDEIERRISPSELLEKVISLTKKNTLMHRLLQSPDSNKSPGDAANDGKSLKSQHISAHRSHSHRNVGGGSGGSGGNKNYHTHSQTPKYASGAGSTGGGAGAGGASEMSVTQSDTNPSSKASPHLTFSKRDSSSNRVSFQYTSGTSRKQHNHNNSHNRDTYRDAMHSNGNNEYSMSGVSVISETAEKSHDGGESRRQSMSQQTHLIPNGTNSNNNVSSGASGASGTSGGTGNSAESAEIAENGNKADSSNKTENTNLQANGMKSSGAKPVLDRPTSTPARSRGSDLDLQFLRYDTYATHGAHQSKGSNISSNLSSDGTNLVPGISGGAASVGGSGYNTASEDDVGNGAFRKASNGEETDEKKEREEREREMFLHRCDFDPLYQWFDNVMDLDKDGIISYHDWQYLLVELSPHLRYEIDSLKIQKCFSEFDLAKNNFLTKEECAVVMGKTYLRAIAKKKVEFRKSSKRKLELDTVLLNNSGTNGVDATLDDSLFEFKKYNYLRNVSSMDVKSYFVSIINHMLKKMNATSHNIATQGTLQSPTATMSMNFDPKLRRTSRSLSSRKKPPPPKRPSRQLSVSKGRISGATPPPPPPRKESGPPGRKQSNSGK